MEILFKNIKDGLTITFFVFVMMMLVDYLNVLTKGRLGSMVGGGRVRQYAMTSFLGVIPGCLGSFMDVSFYLRGLITFGALAGGMIATSGDEAFVMLSLFPEKALILLSILFGAGIVTAFFADAAVSRLGFKPCEDCHPSKAHTEVECRHSSLREIFLQVRQPSLIRFLIGNLLIIGIYFTAKDVYAGPGWEDIALLLLMIIGLGVVATVPDHYLHEHIWEHIAKKHMGRIFLWSLGALLVVNVGLEFFHLEAFVRSHLVWVFLIAILVGIIPTSGPHLIFTMLFAKGLIPFSILLANAIVQSGHGLIPLLSYSIKDSVAIKIFNIIAGLLIGGLVYWIGW